MAKPMAWKPTSEEIRTIVAELAPVIDECVRRSRAALAGLAATAGERPPHAA